MLKVLQNIATATVTACVLTLGCATVASSPRSSASVEGPAEPGRNVTAPEPAIVAESPATETPAPTPAEEPRDGLRKASRPPLELLTGNNVVYVFNFAGSKVGEAAKGRCESEHGDDPAAARACLGKQRDGLAMESVRFVKDAHGQYWWVTYNRYRGNLLKWHKIQFLPGKADDDSITLNLTGKDKGIAPMAKVPTFLKIELPNDYSIVVSDPDHGDLLFDAKIGLMDQE